VATFKVMFRPLVDKIPGFGEHKPQYYITRATVLSDITGVRGTCSARLLTLVLR
jgi:hypothetical protein